MARGPKPQGAKAMTAAERQARYRALHANDAVPVVRFKKPQDRRPKPQRWKDAVAELTQLQESYQGWLDSLPESLAGSATADALEAICAIDLSELDIEPPRGFGRD